MENANEVASTINCMEGSVRSLALNTKSTINATVLALDVKKGKLDISDVKSDDMRSKVEKLLEIDDSLLESIASNDPDRAAWDFAKSVKGEFGDAFTEADAQKHFTSTFFNGNLVNESKSLKTKPVSKTGNTASKKSEFGRKAKSIADDKSKTINEKIRLLFAINCGNSEIARNVMGQNEKPLSYQRVKNITKRLQKERKIA